MGAIDDTRDLASLGNDLAELINSAQRVDAQSVYEIVDLMRVRFIETIKLVRWYEATCERDGKPSIGAIPGTTDEVIDGINALDDLVRRRLRRASRLRNTVKAAELPELVVKLQSATSPWTQQLTAYRRMYPDAEKLRTDARA